MLGQNFMLPVSHKHYKNNVCNTQQLKRFEDMVTQESSCYIYDKTQA